MTGAPPGSIDETSLACHTSRMTGRLNARLDEALAEKLAVLQRRTGKNVTEIVRESIERYYAQTEPRAARDRLAAAGFIACGEAEAGLSAGYKAALADLAAAKVSRRR